VSSVIYRADVIGSMLRPPSLKQARLDFEAGALPAHEFKRVEDRSVDMAIAVQEAAGLPVVTDGEMRRAFYFDAIWGDFEGLVPIDDSERTVFFRGGEEPLEFTIPGAVVERLRRRRTAAVEEYAYARSRARVPVKMTVPNPLAFAFLWNSERSSGAYADVHELFEHATELLRDEIVELAALGCRYVQVDLPELTMVVDEQSRATHWDLLGLTPEWLLSDGIALVDAMVADIPGVHFGLHFCRGNHASKWLSQGGYEAMAACFGRIPHYDALLLEYDTDRAGGFEPLREVPDDKVVVLGLISTKNDVVEDADAVLGRIEEAAGFFPRDQLALSTQCGFASAVHGNALSEDTQEAKLRLVARVAERAWGEAPVTA
jgi:5-methyltetrahydropteroyltriglutamate--homocysteine methyltransferase